MSPGKQTELFHVVLLDQRQNKPNETNAIQGKGKETMIGDHKFQIFLKLKQIMDN